jgi:uncharacterized protein YabN with tetrapyrrole methylase and pyrophosphatase domain
MQRAEKLLYLVGQPSTAIWLRELNPTACTLDDCYALGKPREQAYREMTRRILSEVRAGFRVCAAFYGHPGVLVDATHDAIRRARREGFPARMLPGVSADGCLFADLGIDPGEHGCQSFEATDFLASHRRFDSSSGLILWQVGVLGEGSIRKAMACRSERLRVLTSVLRRHYAMDHRVVLYEAAQYPVCNPIIKRMALSKLSQTTVLPMATLYVPPKRPRPLDPKIMRWLDED